MTDIFVAPKKESPKEKTHSILNDPHHINFLSTFCQNPKGVSFQSQKPNESIILFLRAHLVTNLSWILIALLLIILPLIIAIVLPILNMNIFSFPSVARFVVIYILFYYLIVSSYVFVSFLHWFYYVFMVTTEQVVDIDYSDIVIHNVSVTSLNQIQDVKYTQSGFISTFFNYGNIFVQTAGTQVNFEEFSVPKPREAIHIIGDVIGKNPTKGSR